MYPAQLFSLYPPFPRDNKVFVAMSFDARFDNRWNNVIAPGIRRIVANDIPLEPVRVDTRTISESILTEILTGVTRSRLVFADITTMGELDGRPVRNGNVMYEIGLAHAVRLAEEVLLFRSDNDRLLFDTSTIRVNHYDPDGDPAQALKKIASAILAALKEIDLRKQLAVSQAVDTLDYPSWRLLMQTMNEGTVSHPEIRTMRDVMERTRWAAAISNLLALGALRTEFVSLNEESLSKIDPSMSEESLLKYRPTEFGAAMFREVVSRMGMLSPEVQATMTRLFGAGPTAET